MKSRCFVFLRIKKLIIEIVLDLRDKEMKFVKFQLKQTALISPNSNQSRFRQSKSLLYEYLKLQAYTCFTYKAKCYKHV